MTRLDDPVLVLCHLGYGGEGLLGKYLFEMMESYVPVMEWIDHENNAYDPNYFRHESMQMVRTYTDDDWVSLNYEFDENGCPTRVFAEIKCDVYQVEYDLVAGDLIYEEVFEDSVYRIYEVVMQNYKETFIRTAYATQEILVTYR